MQGSRTVLITGASAGIGAAIAVKLAGEGYRVFGTTRHLANQASFPPELKAAMAEVQAGRHPLRMLELDVTKEESVNACVRQVLDEAGRIDVLINNAGWGVFGAIEDIPVEMAASIFDTIVFGALRMAKAVIPAMRERRSGLILNISSIAGRTVTPFQAHYSAAKFALEALSLGFRHELLPFGVDVTILEPGDIRTRFFALTQLVAPAGSPYGPWRDPAYKYAGEVIEKAPPPTVVAEKVAAILRKRRPGPIYTCGPVIQRIAPTVFRFVTKRVELRLMRLFYGLGFK